MFAGSRLLLPVSINFVTGTLSFVITRRDEKSIAVIRNIRVNMKVNVIQICSAVCFSCQSQLKDDE